MMKIGAGECDATFELTFILTTLENISLPILLRFLQFFC